MKHMQRKLLVALFLIIINVLPFSTVFAGTQKFWGIDVSKNNGTVDWNSVFSSGYRFAMIKTGDGKDTGDSSDIDSQFETNYTNAKEAGLFCGVYHMVAGNTPEDAEKEANYCLSILDGRPLDHQTTATYKIVVKKAPTSIRFVENNKTIKQKTLKKGQSYSVKTARSNNSASQYLSYYSSNKKVASISSSGKLLAKKAGTTTITVKTYNGKTATLKVTVKK